MVMLAPINPAAGKAFSAGVNSSKWAWILTYCISRPLERRAAFWKIGDFEWATGSPKTASRAGGASDLNKSPPEMS